MTTKITKELYILYAKYEVQKLMLSKYQLVKKIVTAACHLINCLKESNLLLACFKILHSTGCLASWLANVSLCV